MRIPLNGRLVAKVILHYLSDQSHFPADSRTFSRTGVALKYAILTVLFQIIGADAARISLGGLPQTASFHPDQTISRANVEIYQRISRSCPKQLCVCYFWKKSLASHVLQQKSPSKELDVNLALQVFLPYSIRNTCMELTNRKNASEKQDFGDNWSSLQKLHVDVQR